MNTDAKQGRKDHDNPKNAKILPVGALISGWVMFEKGMWRDEWRLGLEDCRI